MVDIELVIKIPEWLYDSISEYPSRGLAVSQLESAILHGTPLPKGHGDLIDRKLALSDDGLCEFHMYDDYVKMRNYLKSIPTIIEADKEQTDAT